MRVVFPVSPRVFTKKKNQEKDTHEKQKQRTTERSRSHMVRTWLQCCAFRTEISLACLPNRADRVLRGVYVTFVRVARMFSI